MNIELPTDDEPVRVIEGDCLDVLRALPDGCVDAVITDPPYPCIKREYGYWTEAEWFDLMNPVVEQCRRVLKPTGSAVFVLQPNSERVGRMRTWLWEFMAKWGREWGIVQDVYWFNSQAMPTRHCQRDYGLMRPSVKAVVWAGLPDCYREQSTVLAEPAESTKRDKRAADNRLKYSDSSHHVRHSRSIGTCLERGATPFNLMKCGRGGGNGHGAGTPMNLCRWWVRYICPPGGTVLEPFLGSGTVALAALEEGRKCLGVERVPKYAEIARERVRKVLDKGLFAEV